jgi:hypothetical protein
VGAGDRGRLILPFRVSDGGPREAWWRGPRHGLSSPASAEGAREGDQVNDEGQGMGTGGEAGRGNAGRSKCTSERLRLVHRRHRLLGPLPSALRASPGVTVARGPLRVAPGVTACARPIRTHLLVPAAEPVRGVVRPPRSVPRSSSFEAKAAALAPQERGGGRSASAAQVLFFRRSSKRPPRRFLASRPAADPWAGIGALRLYPASAPVFLRSLAHVPDTQASQGHRAAGRSAGPRVTSLPTAGVRARPAGAAPADVGFTRYRPPEVCPTHKTPHERAPLRAGMRSMIRAVFRRGITSFRGEVDEHRRAEPHRLSSPASAEGSREGDQVNDEGQGMGTGGEARRGSAGRSKCTSERLRLVRRRHRLLGPLPSALRASPGVTAVRGSRLGFAGPGASPWRAPRNGPRGHVGHAALPTLQCCWAREPNRSHATSPRGRVGSGVP